MVVMRIPKVLRNIRNKVWNPFEIDSFRDDVVVSLTLVEMHFPPSFFDIMTHLLYLMDELDLCGPVSIRWMYLVEIYMKTLKTYVCDMVKPKGSMVEGYIKDECLSFIIEFLQRFEVV